MVTEHVILEIKAGQNQAFEESMIKGKSILESANGASNVRLLRGCENPNKYLLMIDWQSVEHHVEFTKQPQMDDVRSILGEYLGGKPNMEHFELA